VNISLVLEQLFNIFTTEFTESKDIILYSMKISW